MLDSWIPPIDAGMAVGCLASTNTFQSEFFEEECLARFLSIESKPDEDGPVYLIEREEKLNNISCAAVWVDQAWARQKRNLRWDLVPVRLPTGILHSKVSVLQWTKCVRVIIGSANLTEQAFRKNQEIFCVIDLNTENNSDKSVAISLIRHLLNIIHADKFINPVIRKKHDAFLSGVLSFVETLPHEVPVFRRNGYLSFPIIIEPSGPSFPEQVMKIWNDNVSITPPENCYLTSPFFDPAANMNLPAIRLWEMMKKKGAAVVDIYTTGEIDLENKPARIHAPESINKATPPGRNDVETRWHILPQTESEGKNVRPLHLKSYWFENSGGWKLLVLGSSNFTSKGWGLMPNSNYEANIAFLTNEDHREQLNEVSTTFIDTEMVDVTNIKWEPLPNEDEQSASTESPLPPFFQSATLIKDTDLFIELRFASLKAPEGFVIRDEQGEKIFLDYQKWQDAGAPLVYRIPIEIGNIPAYFLINLDAVEHPVCLTINIIDQHCLPPPDELKNLPLDILAQIITSASPLHHILRKYLSRIRKKAVDQKSLIDPHERVDTSTFLLQKTRKYSFAINTVKSKLEQLCATVASIEWRLYGPVGLRALVDAMVKEAGDNNSEAIFFLTELWSQLGKVKPATAEGITPARIVRQKLNEFRNRLAERIKLLWDSSETDSIQSYSKKVLENVTP